jgi:hypothetical protein
MLSNVELIERAAAASFEKLFDKFIESITNAHGYGPKTVRVGEALTEFESNLKAFNEFVGKALKIAESIASPKSA